MRTHLAMTVMLVFVLGLAGCTHVRYGDAEYLEFYPLRSRNWEITKTSDTLTIRKNITLQPVAVDPTTGRLVMGGP